MKLELTSKLADPTPISVDGEDYNILGLDHLSPAEEAEAMALFARFDQLQHKLSMEEKFTKQKEIAATVRTVRISIISRLTDIPTDVAGKLPVGAQAQLLEAVKEVMEGGDTAEEAKAEEKGEQGDEHLTS